MVRKTKSKTKTKKISKRKSTRKVSKRKSIKRKNPREGERFRQKHKQKMHASRGPEIPNWLAEDNSPEAEKLKEKIRKQWKRDMEWNLSSDYY